MTPSEEEQIDDAVETAVKFAHKLNDALESKKDSQISVFSTGNKEASFEVWFNKHYSQ